MSTAAWLIHRQSLTVGGVPPLDGAEQTGPVGGRVELVVELIAVVVVVLLVVVDAGSTSFSAKMRFPLKAASPSPITSEDSVSEPTGSTGPASSASMMES